MFVVITVLLVIFTGIVVYLATMDRRIRRMEKELKNRERK